MKKKIIALLLLVMTLCPLIVACGSSYYNYDSYKEFIRLGDISKVQIKEQDIQNEILGAYHDFFSDEISASTLEKETVTSGAVKYGDTINIDYKGYLVSTGEAFDGGSTYDDDGKANGSELEIGSGSFIPGFESAIIGHEIGEKFSIHVTFPNLYSSDELAGKKTRFDVVINKVTTRYKYPDMTDAKVKEQSGGEYETVEEFKEAARKTAIENLTWQAYTDLCVVKKWPEKELKNYYKTGLDQYKNVAAMYGITFDTYATSIMGTDGDSLRKTVMNSARQQCKSDLMILALVKEHKLTMSDAKLEKAMKAVYKESDYDGDYKDYIKEYTEEAVMLSAYTEVVLDCITKKITHQNIIGKNGIYGTVSSGIYYYINDVQQTGWQNVDIDGDGNADKYFFDPALGGKAYNNIAVHMPVEGGTDKQYLKFGEKGIFNGVANDELIRLDLGYAYVKADGALATGVYQIDRTGLIDGKEDYLFDKDGYMATGVVQLTAEKFPGVDFGADNEDKYFNFGTDGVFNLNGKYGENSQNALAGGLIEEKAYENGVMVKNASKVFDGSTYYFDADGKMLKAQFVEIEGELYYFDNGGKMLVGTADAMLEQVFDGITYKIDSTGKVDSAQYLVEGVAQTSYTHAINGNVYYFGADGKMVRNAAVNDVTVDGVSALRCFDGYGKMIKSQSNYNIGGTLYNIDENGVAVLAA